jgi:tetratricopeptide (TPR) repeat protein
MPDAIDRGISLLRTAARANPDDPKICMDLMIGLCRKGQSREAITEFVTFVKHCPEATQLHHDFLVRLSRGNGLANELFQGFRQAAQDTHDGDAYLVYYGFGLLYAGLGMHVEAIPVYEESIRRNGEYAAAYHNLGLSLHFSGALAKDPERTRLTAQAIDACRIATGKSSTLAEPHFFLGVILMKEEDPIPAFSHFAEFIRLAKPYLASHVPEAEISIGVLREKIKTQGRGA